MPKLLQPADTFKLIQDRIDSREWWSMPVASAEGVALMEDIVSRFYSGKDPTLCNLLLLPIGLSEVPILGFLMASKTAMTHADLSDLFGISIPKDAKADLIVPATTPLSAMVWLWKHFRWQPASSVADTN